MRLLQKRCSQSTTSLEYYPDLYRYLYHPNRTRPSPSIFFKNYYDNFDYDLEVQEAEPNEEEAIDDDTLGRDAFLLTLPASPYRESFYTTPSSPSSPYSRIMPQSTLGMWSEQSPRREPLKQRRSSPYDQNMSRSTCSSSSWDTLFDGAKPRPLQQQYSASPKSSSTSGLSGPQQPYTHGSQGAFANLVVGE